jgi:hypothetical protein
MAYVYDNMVDALNDLKQRGYTTDFNLHENCIVCAHSAEEFADDTFEVDENYRFEGMNDPGDSSMIYAISTNSGKKGVLLTAYGAYTSSMNAAILRKLSIDRKDD